MSKRWRIVTTLRLALSREPLLRLLAINLAAGVAAAALLLGGLLALNPSGLRDLIFADRAPATALGLLLFGFVVTFGSTAMGTAIMAIGQSDGDDHPRGTAQPLPAYELSGGSHGPRRE
jgi:hypothetical protein